MSDRNKLREGRAARQRDDRPSLDAKGARSVLRRKVRNDTHPHLMYWSHRPYFQDEIAAEAHDGDENPESRDSPTSGNFRGPMGDLIRSVLSCCRHSVVRMRHHVLFR